HTTPHTPYITHITCTYHKYTELDQPTHITTTQPPTSNTTGTSPQPTTGTHTTHHITGTQNNQPTYTTTIHTTTHPQPTTRTCA
ncbi:hypothetical protein ACIQAC_30915, partial [Streptomyces sp. NPDC088387]